MVSSEATVILKKLCRIEEKMGIQVEPKESKFVRELLQETNPVDIEKPIEDVT